jgi:hypothetical protein
MGVKSTAFSAKSRIALALGLCLLSVAFAVEAKTAWFGPASGPGSEVAAAKAWPADLPRVIEHGVTIPQAVPTLISFALMAALSSLRSYGNILSPRRESAPGPANSSPAAFLSPQFFFRPPPITA